MTGWRFAPVGHSTMMNWLQQFVENKILVAEALHKGKCGGSYSEATMIVCSVLSGIAALLWPGEGIDRKRFVELLIAYCGDHLQTKYISTELLVQDFEKASEQKKIDAANRIKNKYLPRTPPLNRLVITGEDADGPEDDLLKECPQISRKDIREFSYPNLLYRQVRSSLVHEYRLGNSVSSWPMTDSVANASYFNASGNRLIYFHFAWLIKLCRTIAYLVENQVINPPTAKPENWWLDGIV